MADVTPPDPAAEELARVARRVASTAGATPAQAAAAETAAADLGKGAQRLRAAAGKVRTGAVEFNAERNALLQAYIEAQQLLEAERQRFPAGSAQASVKPLREAAERARLAAVRGGAITNRALPTVGGYRPASASAGERPAINPYSPAWLERLEKARRESPNFRVRLNEGITGNVPNFSTGLVTPDHYGVRNQHGVHQQGTPRFASEAEAQQYLQRIQSAVTAVTSTVVQGEAQQTAAVETGTQRRKAARTSEAATVRVTPTMANELSYQKSVLDTDFDRHVLSDVNVPRNGGNLTLPPDRLKAIAEEMERNRGDVARDNLAAESSGKFAAVERKRLNAIEEFTRRVATATGQATAAEEQVAAAAQEEAAAREKAAVAARESAVSAQRATAVVGDSEEALRARAAQLAAADEAIVARANANRGVPTETLAAKAAADKARAEALAKQPPAAPPPPPPPPRRPPAPPGGGDEPPRYWTDSGRSAGGGGRQVVSYIARLEQDRAAQLAVANQELAQAQAASRAAATALGKLAANAEKASVDELVAAQQTREAANELVAARRAQISAIEAEIAAEQRAALGINPRATAGGGGRALVQRLERDLPHDVPTPVTSIRAPGVLAGRTGAGAVAHIDRELATADQPRTIGSAITQGQAQAAAAKRESAQESARLAREESQLARQIEAEERAAANAARTQSILAGGHTRVGQALRYTGTAMDSSSMAMRRHGALTTEFISAAARGDASIREWGFQLGSTAAKFAGWTAVSVPVFAVLGAIRDLGQGAIASASGVDHLRRTINDVDASGAQDAFRDLSRQFNVPIEDTVSAVGGMGAVFHRQAEAVNAARAALYAYRTGGVDVATATKDLTAIQQGLGASSDDLLNIFDQLNYVQNNYGARIPDLESGLARTVGAFKQAGGTVEELITLMVTLNRTANVSGPQAATIIGRTIGQIRKPESAAALRGYGVDPEANIGDVFRQAQAAAGRQGADVRGIAQALGGQYFARQLTPLLQRSDYSDKLRGELEGGAAKGASERELQNVLNQIDEQVAQIGTNLQRMGSSLAESGLLTPLGLMLRTFNGVLGVTNRVLDAFNELPKPLRTALALMIEMRAAAAILRRLDVGGQLGGGGRFKRFITRDETAVVADRVRGSSRDLLKGARGEQERTAIAAYRAAAAEERARIAYGVELKRIADAEKANLAAGVEASVAAEQAAAERLAAEQRLHAANDKLISASQEAAAQLEVVTLLEGEETALKQKQAGLRGAARDAAAVRHGRDIGAVISQSSERPNSTEPIAVGGAEIGRSPAATAEVAALAAASAQREQAIIQSARVGEVLKDSLKKQGAEFQKLRAQGEGLTAFSGRTIALATGAGAAAVKGAKAAALGVAGLGRMLYGFLGPLGVAFIGFEIVSHVVDKIHEKQREARELREKLQREPQNESQYYRQRALLTSSIDEDAHRRDVARARREREARESAEGQRQGGVVRFFEEPKPDTGDDGLDWLRNGPGESETSKVARTALKALPDHKLYPDVIMRDVRASVRRFNEGKISLDSLNNLLDEALGRIEVGPGSKGGKHDRRVQIQQAKLAAATGASDYNALLGTFDRNLQTVGDQTLKDSAGGINALIELGQGSKEQVRKYFRRALILTARNRGVDTPEAQNLYADTFSGIQETLSTLSEQGRGGLGQRSLHGTATALRRRFQAATRATKRDLEKAVATVKAERAAVNAVTSDTNRGFGVGELTHGLAGQNPHVASLARAQALRAALRSKIGSQQRAARQLLGVIKALDAALNEGADQIGHIEAETALAVARANGPHAEYLAQQGGFNRELKLAKGDERTNILANKISATKQENQRIADEARQNAEDAKQKAQQAADEARQAAEEAEQRAVELINARYDYLSSLTDNPIRLDRLQVRRDQELLGHAKTQAEKYQAQAALNNDRRKLAEDVGNRRIENLDFAVEIERITTQQEITRLQQLYRTTTAGSEFKRNLMMKIKRLQHDLQNEANASELNVGNIKLPTVYDVRRMARQGTHTAPQVNVSHRNEFRVQIDNPESADRFWEDFDRHVGTTVRSGMRSIGAR